MPPQAPTPNTSLFSGFTRLSKLLAVVVLALYVTVKVAPSSMTYLALVPGRWVQGAASLLVLEVMYSSHVAVGEGGGVMTWNLHADRTIPCVWNIVTSQFLETHGALVRMPTQFPYLHVLALGG
jgi:hypothetical protein